MKLYNTNINISASIILLVSLAIVSSVLVYLYIFTTFAPKWGALIGGAAISSIAALFQYLVSFFDYRNNEKPKNSGVIEFLSSRGDKKYYQKIVKNSRTELNLLFHTSKRFCEDFCSDGQGDDLLIDMLNTKPKLNVKLLILSKSLLPQSEHAGYDIASVILSKMQQKFGDRFQVKYYNHAPTHNIFISDNDTIIGPYFEGVKSKYSHSIHFKSNADFITEYKEYFDVEWDISNGSD
jgi:hypothetical protein